MDEQLDPHGGAALESATVEDHVIRMRRERY
jgi:hypothetical protein